MHYKESAMIRPLRPLLLSLLCAGLLAGCAASQSAPTSSPAPCEVAYTFAPGNYIIDLASGSEVVLDPLMHDFPLFCTPQKPRMPLNSPLPTGSSPMATGASTGSAATLKTSPPAPDAATCSSVWPPSPTGCL